MNIKKTLLDESLPPDNMSARSATEIVERMKELSQNLGAAFGRLINETMTPIITRTLELMDQEGLIELPLKINGLEVTIEPQSPLAMAQNMEKVGNVLQFLQISQALGGAGNALVNPEAVGDYLLDNLGIDANLRTTPEQRAAIVQQAQQLLAQQQAMQQPGQGANSPGANVTPDVRQAIAAGEGGPPEAISPDEEMARPNRPPE